MLLRKKDGKGTALPLGQSRILEGLLSTLTVARAQRQYS